MATLRQYLTVTSPLHPEGAVKLFVAVVEPHNPVSLSSIARWLRDTLQQAGIDVGIFGAHSVREASSSATAAGVTTNDILKGADWSSESVFRNFYYRPTGDVAYGRVVLSQCPGSETQIIECMDIAVVIQYCMYAGSTSLYLELYEKGEVEHINGPTRP